MSRFWSLASSLLVGCLVLLLVGASQAGDKKKEDDEKFNPLFAPTPNEVIDKMFEVAKATKKDVVFDLGAGEGHIIVRAGQKGMRAVGVELNPERIETAKEKIKEAGVGKLVEIRKENALKVKDMERATIVTMYMLPDFMTQWAKLNRDRLKPGTRIVSHDYKWDESIKWPPDRTIEFQGPTRTHTIYLWTVKGER